jgi:hypothetical protein
MEQSIQEVSSLAEEDHMPLVNRYIELREQNMKTHLCVYYFRQRCLKTAERCSYSHGLEDLRRMPSEKLLEIRQEIFNIKVKLRKMRFVVLFNFKSRKYEIYKTRDIERLRAQKTKEYQGIEEEDKGVDLDEDDDEANND